MKQYSSLWWWIVNAIVIVNVIAIVMLLLMLSRYFMDLESSLFRILGYDEAHLGLLSRFNPMCHGIWVIIFHEFWFDEADLGLLLMIWLIAECIMD